MSRSLVFTTPALRDLDDLGVWLSSESDLDTARAYLRRVRSRCETLADFANRGTPRLEFGVGVRSIPFERRLLILYRVTDMSTVILRIVDGARDLDRLPLG